MILENLRVADVTAQRVHALVARLISHFKNARSARRRGRHTNAPAAFIHPCRPVVAERPPSGPGWGA